MSSSIGWFTGSTRTLRYGLVAIVLALAGTAVPGAVAVADQPESAPDTPAFTDAAEFLAAVQGGKLLGVPPLPAVAGGSAAKLSSPQYWSNYVQEVLTNNKILLPLPIDVVKPDIVLPHAPVAAGEYVSALPITPVDLRAVTYERSGRTKTVADFLIDTETDTIGFVHNGSLVAEYFANGWSADLAHQAWSTTKSFVSTLVGIAVDQGLIGSLGDPIETYVPELNGTAWQGVTIENLLRMRSGVRWDEHAEDIGQNDQFLQWIDLALDYYSNGQLGRSRNEFLKSLPRIEPQGVRFNYNSANTQVLAWLLESVYQQPFHEVLSEQLWRPVGMEAPADIMTDRTGAAIASQALFARTRDLARLGELMRNNGRTPEGHQVVSPNWVTAATTRMSPAADAGDSVVGGYGYQWWNGATPDGFQASGFQDQFITVSPQAASPACAPPTPYSSLSTGNSAVRATTNDMPSTEQSTTTSVGALIRW